MLPWFERVASLKNLADPPSRDMYAYNVEKLPDIPLVEMSCYRYTYLHGLIEWPHSKAGAASLKNSSQ